MVRLFKLVVVVLIALSIYATTKQLWNASQFDSYFAGYLQSAGRLSADKLETGLIDLAEEHGIQFGNQPVMLVRRDDRYEVTFSYHIPIGFGGLSYSWNRSITGTTSFGEAVGVPQGIDQIPSSRSHEIRGLRQRPSQVKSKLKGLGQ
jgi:hypothetical protein